jgi:hypothetical protein
MDEIEGAVMKITLRWNCSTDDKLKRVLMTVYEKRGGARQSVDTRAGGETA